MNQKTKRKNKLTSLLLAVCMVIAMVPSFTIDLTAFAAETATSNPSDDWEYTTNADGTATLTEYIGSAVDVYIPSTITDDAGERISVTALGEGVFRGNTAINSATFGEGITTIGESAFEGATNLVCIVSPETLTTIGDRAFYGCTVFNSVILYDAVTSIGADVFAECPNVTVWCNEGSNAHTYAVSNSIPYEIINPDATPETYVQDGVTYYIMNGEAYAIGYDGSETEVVVPAMVEGYPVVELRETFKNCSEITNVILPSTIVGIKPYSFYGCTNLSTVNIPNKIEKIEKYVFCQCLNLTSISFPIALKSIENNSFADCEKIASIKIPDNVTSIGGSAFSNCKNLSVVDLPKEGVLFGIGVFSGCENLISITLPADITEIPQGMFVGCKKLSKIELPDTVRIIGNVAFNACTGITDITLPDNVSKIGDYAFMSCSNLENIHISENMQTIGDNAFLGCAALTIVKIPDSVTSVSLSSFPDSVLLIVNEKSYMHTFAEENELLYHKIVNDGGDAEIIKLDGITYYAQGNEAIAVSSDDTLSVVEIPDFVNEFPVTRIGKAFKNKQQLQKITLPRGIKILDASAFSYCSSLVTITLPETLTTIKNDAFYSCSSLKSVKIPDSVTKIERYAFHGCSKLENIDISNSLTELATDVFSNCTSLKTVNIPNSVTTISSFAFAYCSKLENVEFSNNLLTIGDHAFYRCSNLVSVNFPDGLTSIGKLSFYNCANLKNIKIPDSVLSIATKAFGECPNLLTAFIPKSVSIMYADTFPSTSILYVYENSYAHKFLKENDLLFKIINDEENETNFVEIDGVRYLISNEGAIAISANDTIKEIKLPDVIDGFPLVELRNTFKDCSQLSRITLPDSILIVGESAFSGCTNLVSIQLSQNTISIGTSAFQGCKKLSKIIMPNSITTIGDKAFYNCSHLTTIGFSKNITEIGDSAFYGCTYLSEINLPETLTTIGSAAFQECVNINEITIPCGIKKLKKSLFYGCTNLFSITIPNSVTELEKGVFYNCLSLADINLPESIETIGDSVFYGCSNLERIELPYNLKTIGNSAFSGCYALTNLKLPNHLYSISSFALKNTSVSEMIIPTSVKELSISSFPSTAILCVYENSYAHNFAKDNNLLYFVLRETSNPEISYGSGISGTVTLDGSPASGATVELLYDDGVVKETVTTDDTGAYSFTYAEVGAYTVRATAGSASGTENVSIKRMNAFDVFLSGETDIVLKNSWTVSGNVSPADASVTLTDTDGNIIESLDITGGMYSFSNVPNGSYIIKAETENGSAVREVTVFDGDVAVEDITIASQSVVIKGTTVLEKNGKHNPKIWVEVTLYDMNGNAVDSVKTESDGSYSFSGVPLGDYAIVARTVEMENHEEKGYLKPNNYAGFAYIEAEAAGTYEVETIYLREGRKNKSGLSGKVTAHGEHQACEVTLRDIFGNESARSLTTEKNGKYEFCNVPDGIYVITAITESNGMGFTVVGVIDGIVFGETDIVVYKDEKVKEREDTRHDRIPHCSGRDDAIKYRDKIAEEKRWYDGLSPKKKRHCSKEYIDWLMQLIEWITELKCEAPNGATLSGGEEVLSGDELESDDTFTLTLEISDATETEIGEDGIQTDEQFVQQSIHDAAGDKTIAKYYNISLSKTDGKGKHNIKSIARDTDTTGKVRITMDIPEEHRGHKHYHFVHVHNGEPMTLVDLDDNPDTITFEVDRFSTFALTYTDEVLSVDGEVEEVLDTKNLILYNLSPTTLNGQTIYRVALYAGIDSLNYKEVGYEIVCTDNGVSKEVTTKNVYGYVSYTNSTGPITRTPEQFGENCKYLFGFIEGFSEKYKSANFTFRPFAVDFNGNKIYGKYTELSGIYTK